MRHFALTAALVCLASALAAQQCPGTSKLAMTRGEYDSRPGVTFTLQNFLANMVPKGNSSPMCYVKETNIQHGRVFVSMESLTNLFREKMANSAQPNASTKQEMKDDKSDKSNGHSPVTDLELTTKGDQLVIHGKTKKVIPIPFELEGPLDTANGHTLRFKIEKIKAAGIEAKWLLEGLGVHLTNMLHPDSAKGVTVQDNAILFDTEAIANVKGQMSRAQIAGNALVVDFVPAGKKLAKAAPQSTNQPKTASAAPITATATMIRKK